MRLLRRIFSWFRRKSDLSAALTLIERADGSKALVDRATLDYLQSAAPNPTQDSLDNVLTRARRVRILREGAVAGEPIGNEILYETEDPRALAALCEALRIVDGPAGHCMCYGDPTIEFLAKDGGRLAVIGVHHGLRIRWDGWKDDAQLVDGQHLLEWLADHGVSYPLSEYQEMYRQAEIRRAAEARWQKAMPACLKPFREQVNEFGMVPDISPWQVAIEVAHPDACERALVLFNWFGCGLGPWSGFPAYESVAEKLLMTIPISDVFSAANSPDLSEAQLEGAARFLAGWEFQSQRGAELAQLARPTKRRLLEHSLQSTDGDKLARARAAFGPSAE